MFLTSMPDAKPIRPFLSLNTDYEILSVLGNAFVIQTSDPELKVAILQERFSVTPKEDQ